MNIFQKASAEAKAAQTRKKNGAIALSKKIEALIKVKPTDANIDHVWHNIMPTYFIDVTCTWSPAGKYINHRFYVGHKKEAKQKCGPNGCPVKKPIDYAKFFKELEAALKTKPRE